MEEDRDRPDHLLPPYPPDAITRTGTFVEAVLHGDALMCLLDAAFHGDGTIEILGGGSNCHQMEVTEIAMQGRDSWVSLAAMGETLRLM